MGTALPIGVGASGKVASWWESLDDQERIIRVLKAGEDSGCTWERDDSPSYMAEKPWKWAAEAYNFAEQEGTL